MSEESLIFKPCQLIILFVIAVSGALFSGCANTVTKDGRHSTEYVMPSNRPDFSASRTKAELPDEYSGHPLTPAACLDIALQNNQRVAAYWNLARAAESQIGEKRSPYYPDLDFSAGAAREDKTNLDGRDTTPGAANVWDYGLKSSYLLFDGGARSGRLQAADAQSLEARMRFNAVLLDTTYNVRKRYYELLASGRLLSVAEDKLNQAEYHLDLSKARRREGLANVTEELRAETRKAEAELDLIRAEKAVGVAQGNLASAIGLSARVEIEVEDISPDIPGQDLENVEQLLSNAVANRPELRAAVENVAARRAELKAEKAAYMPNISANAGYGMRDRDFPPENEEWWIGVGLNFPIFTGFSRKYKIQRYEFLLAAAEEELDDIMREIELEVWVAWWELKETSRAIDASDKLAVSAEKSLRAAEEEYRNGLSDMVDLIEAATAWSEAFNRQARARTDWHTALAKLERALGVPPKRQYLMGGAE